MPLNDGDDLLSIFFQEREQADTLIAVAAQNGLDPLEALQDIVVESWTGHHTTADKMLESLPNDPENSPIAIVDSPTTADASSSSGTATVVKPEMVKSEKSPGKPKSNKVLTAEMLKEKKRAADRESQRRKRQRERDEKAELKRKVSKLQQALSETETRLRVSEAELAEVRALGAKNLQFAELLGGENRDPHWPEKPFNERRARYHEEYRRAVADIVPLLKSSTDSPGYSTASSTPDPTDIPDVDAPHAITALGRAITLLSNACVFAGQQRMPLITGQWKTSKSARKLALAALEDRFRPLIDRLNLSSEAIAEILALRKRLLSALDPVYEARQQCYSALSDDHRKLSEQAALARETRAFPTQIGAEYVVQHLRKSNTEHISALEENLFEERTLRISFHTQFFRALEPCEAAQIMYEALPSLPDPVTFAEALAVLRENKEI